MIFQSREVDPDWNPLEPDDLELGQVYFDIGFVDGDCLIPSVDTLVLVQVDGRDDNKVFLFRDAISQASGIATDERCASGRSQFCRYDVKSLNSIFDFEGMLDVILLCSLRRNGL